MIRKVSVAYIHSADGGKLAEWYEKTLGLPVYNRWDRWTEFNLEEGSRFAIDDTSFPRSPVEKQPVVISFEVKDIREAVRELHGRGVRFHPSVEETIFDVGPQLVATFQDPDGNWVQLNQPKEG